MIVIASQVACISTLNVSGRMAETVPDRFSPPVLANRALDLVCGRRRSPGKRGREAGAGERHGLGIQDLHLSRIGSGYAWELACSLPRTREVKTPMAAIQAQTTNVKWK